MSTAHEAHEAHKAPEAPQARPQPRRGAAEDDAGCTVIHVDMDAFFASVSIRDRPDLRTRAVLIGSETGRGVVLSATYPARRAGVRSGMPMRRALRMSPGAVIVSPRFDEIGAASAGVMETFHSITDRVQPLSIDEAFLDVSGALRHWPSAVAIGEEIRARIMDEQHITCSVGVAATTQLAKLGSRKAKPDGLVVVPKDGAIAFLHPLGVEELWGVGAKTASRLNKLGLLTVEDLANAPIRVLTAALGPAMGTKLHAMAWGSRIA